MPSKMTEVLDVLKDKGALARDESPMRPGEYDLTGGVPIIDVPRTRNYSGPDFTIYDNVTSPDGRTLVQGHGIGYYCTERDGKLEIETRRFDSDHPFGLIGLYPNDYYTANREFVDQLKASLFS